VINDFKELIVEGINQPDVKLLEVDKGVKAEINRIQQGNSK